MVFKSSSMNQLESITVQSSRNTDQVPKTIILRFRKKSKYMGINFE